MGKLLGRERYGPFTVGPNLADKVLVSDFAKAIARLKEEAGSVGANGVLLEGAEDEQAGSVGTGFGIALAEFYFAGQIVLEHTRLRLMHLDRSTAHRALARHAA